MCFSRRGHLVAALAREIEGDAGDALDFEGVVDLGVDGALLAVAEIEDLLRLAEIDAAGQLAHDHDVEPLDHVALQRRRVGERRITDRGTQIGVEAEVLAQAQQARLRPRLVRDVRPFRPADGGEQHRVGGLGARHVGFRDRRAVRVVGAAADQALLGFEPRQTEPRAGARDLLDFGHHFRADAVAGEKEEFVSRHGAPSLCWGCDAC